MEMTNLIKVIPWGNLNETAIIILALVIVIGSVILAYFALRSKKLKVQEKKNENQMLIKQEEHKLKSEAVKKQDIIVDIKLNKNVTADEAKVGNIKGVNKAKVKIMLDEGTNISNARIKVM